MNVGPKGVFKQHLILSILYVFISKTCSKSAGINNTLHGTLFQIFVFSNLEHKFRTNIQIYLSFIENLNSCVNGGVVFVYLSLFLE